MYNLVNKIQYKDFRRKMKGYSTEEVDEFLDEISEEVNLLEQAKRKAETKIEELEERIDGMIGMEKTIQKALMLAQSVAEEAKFNGEKEVATMVAEANELSKRTVDEALREKEKIESEIKKLKLSFNSYRRRVIDFMSMQFEDFKNASIEVDKPMETDLEEISEEFNEEYGIIKG